MTSLAQVLQYQDIDGKLLALQLFGRRTAFCSSRVATAILKTLERDGDPSYADLAKRAAELRRERCRDV
jgi:hypothetical protein